jgi:hypothetical protein
MSYRLMRQYSYLRGLEETFIDELPQSGFSGTARPKDLWASAESQELAPVGPVQHRDFALRYESKLLEPFGLSGYGCCEPLDLKLKDAMALPNMRRGTVFEMILKDTHTVEHRPERMIEWSRIARRLADERR